MYTKLDDKATPMTLLLKGSPGGGKTFKAAQFPKPALFSFDNNLSGLKKLPPEIRANIKIVDPFKDTNGKDVPPLKVWDNFIALLQKVMDDPEIRTVIIDSLTTLASRLMDKIVGSNDPATKVQIQHYGDFGRYLKWLGEEFLCSPDLNKNVIIIAHERLVRDDLTGKVQYELNIVGQMANTFDLYFTDCWRCYAKQPTSGALEFRVRVLPTDNFNAKCTLSVDPDFDWDKAKDKVLAQVK